MGVEPEEKAGWLTESLSPTGSEYRCLLMKLRVPGAWKGKDQRKWNLEWAIEII